MKKLIFTITIFLITGLNLVAADYYWVGGTGNWNATNRWATTSGGGTFYATPPTSGDNVFFDANSFTASGQIVTINVDAICANMTWTGALNSPQLAGAIARKLSVYGSLTLIAGMNYNFLGDVYFESLNTGKTLTSAGQSFKRNVYFQGVGGWVLQDAFVQTGAFSVFHVKGTLSLNSQSFTANIFNSNYTNVRNLSFGSSVITLTSGSNQTLVFNGTNMTLNAGTSLVKLTGAGAGFYNTTGGGLAFYDLICEAATGSSDIYNLTGSFHNITFNSLGTSSLRYSNTVNSITFAGTGTINDNNNNITQVVFNGVGTINGNGTYGQVTFNKNGSITGNNTIATLELAAGYAYTLTNGKTQLITINLVANGSCTAPITLQSSTAGSQTSISKSSGAVVINYCVMKDINASGGATFTANNTVNFGNNTGWVINPPAPLSLYWVGGTGNWNESTHWSLSSGGIGGACIPSSVDNVFFDANSFSAASQTVTIIGDGNSIAFCKNMNWSGVTNNPTLAGANTQTLHIYGSLTLAANMTYNFLGEVYFDATTAGNTVFTAGRVLDKNHIYLQGVGGGWTLMDGLNMGSKTLYLVNGSLNTNNQPVNAGIFYSYYTSSRSLSLGSSIITLSATSNSTLRFNGTNMTLNAGTSLIKLTGIGAGFNNTDGGGLAFNDLTCEATTGNVEIINLTGAFHNIIFNSTGTCSLRYGNTVNSATFAGTGIIYENGNNINNLVFNGPGTINGNGTYGQVTMNGNGVITGNNTFGTLTFTAGNQYALTFGKTQIITNDLIANGTESQLIIIKSSQTGFQSTISKASGTITVESVSLRDNIATGGAAFIANNSIDLGNNTGWTINAPGGKNYYWVAGTGNWSNAASWSLTSGGAGGAGIPTSIDNVYFDANSFGSAGQTVTITGDAGNNANCLNMDWAGTLNNPTLAGAPGVNLCIYGSMKLIAGMSYTFAGSVYFEATTTGKTITTGGVVLNNLGGVNFQGVGGEWTLQDGLNMGTRNLNLVNGTLNTNSKAVNAGIFNSYNQNTRSLILGASVITLSSTSYQTVYFRGDGMTLDAGTSNFRLTGSGAGFYNIQGSGLFFYDVICEALTGTADIINTNGGFHNITYNSNGSLNYVNTVENIVFQGNGTIAGTGNNITNLVINGNGNISGNSTYGQVTINGTGTIGGLSTYSSLTLNGNSSITNNNTIGTLTLAAGKQYTLTNGKTQTITTNLIATGTATELITIKSSSTGVQSSFSKSGGTVTVQYVSLQDNNATGGATFVANNSIDLGNNTGWNITAPGGKDYYWVGGTGNWNVAAKWSLTSGGAGGAGIPSSIDNVHFDVNSFSAPGQTVTLVGDAANYINCKNMDWTGVLNNPTLAGAGTQTLRIYGSLTLTAGMTYTFAGPIYFESLELGNTITSAGIVLDKNDLYFNGTGGGWTLMDGLNIGAKWLYFIKGTLNTNSQPVTAALFNSNNSNSRTLILGSSQIILTATLYYTFNLNSTNMSLDAGTSLFRFTGAGAGFYYVNGSGLVFYDVIFEALTGAADLFNTNGGFHSVIFNSTGTINYNHTIGSLTFNATGTINGNNTINNVKFYGNGTITGNNTFGTIEFSSGRTYTITNNKTQIITSNLIAEGTCTAPIIIQSNSITLQTTLSKATGTVDVNQVNLQSINATGGAVFTAYNAVNAGNNTGWIFAPIGTQNLYWVGGSGNWNDVNHWASESGGAGGYCLPTQLDNVTFDANSFTQTGQAVYVDIANPTCKNMDWSAATFEPTFTSLSNTYNLNIYGSLILNPGMNFAFSGNVYFLGETTAKSPYLITMAGKNFNNSVYFNGNGGMWTLQDAFTINNNDLTLNFGTLNTNGQTVNVRRFISTNNNTRSLNMGASVINISYNSVQAWYVTGTNFTVSPGTSEIRFTFANGELTSTGTSILTYNKVIFQNPGGFSTLNSDDVFNNVVFSPSGKIMGGGSFSTVLFNGSGETAGNNIFGAVSFMNNGTINGTNTFNTLTFTPGKTYLVQSATTQTIVNDLIFWGNVDNPITLRSATSGTQATFSKSAGTVSGNYINLKDMNATGGATFSVYRSTNLGNNTGWNFFDPPAPICPGDMSVCLNTEPFVLTGATPAGGTYSGIGVSGPVFSPSVAGLGVHTITYTYVDPSSGYTDYCTFLITVKAIPVVTCPTYPNPVCLNSSSFVLTGATPTGGTYSGQGVAGGLFIPSSAGAGTHTITYTVADPETGCFDDCAFEITVYSLPVVTCPGNMSVLNTDPSFTLTATPVGGVYVGTGISGNTFSPSTAGPGVHTITYTYTSPQTGCSASCSFTITVYLYQNINYVTGWNWISFNVLPSTATVNNVMTGFVAQNGDVIKNQTQTMLFNGTSWVPNLTFDPDKTYLLKTAKPSGTFTVRGFSYVNVQDPITINASGWTWIGYKPRVQLSPAQAFVSLAGKFTNQDVLKNQTQTAIYNGTTGNWIPGTFKMNPGVGYKLKYQRSTSSTLIYPASDGSEVFRQDNAETIILLEGDPGWVTTPGMETNMSLFVIDTRINGTSVQNGKVAAFDAISHECRAVEPFFDDDGVAQVILTVGFNSPEAGNKFYFKIWDSDADKTYWINEIGVYVNDDFQKIKLSVITTNGVENSEVTTITETPEISVSDQHQTHSGMDNGNQGIVNITESNQNEIRIYPNPTNSMLNVKGITGESKVALMDARGQLVYSGTRKDDFVLNVEQYPTGVYTLRIISNNRNVTRKIVVE